ncbi:MAG: tRNA (guanosine(46)-N7)-methyltransferase TrmB [Clostridia bacterium]|nr:tRNA (guanosine(46)-N7)-methyltransferase TrmB [Clostridia bacterium]
MRMRRKPWTEPMIDNCPFFVGSPSTVKGHWQEHFPKKQPMWLEIGCGKGVSTVQMAHDNRNINIIAVDEVRHVLAVSIKNTYAEYGDDAVDNLIYSNVDAMKIFDTFDRADGIERIIINFCNPWNDKAKQHKRRLTHTRQLLQYRDFLAPDGRIYMKTDDDMLFMATKRYLNTAGFEIEYITDDLHASGYSPNYVSEHEKLYTEQGCKINFLIARMLPDIPGELPQTED